MKKLAKREMRRDQITAEGVQSLELLRLRRQLRQQRELVGNFVSSAPRQLIHSAAATAAAGAAASAAALSGGCYSRGWGGRKRAGAPRTPSVSRFSRNYAPSGLGGAPAGGEGGRRTGSN